VLLVVVSPEFEYVGIGYLIGTMFGQATMAAAWTALGPFPLLWRLPLSLGWLATLTASLAANIELFGQSDEIWIVMGACVLSQWIALQVPLWFLAIAYGLQMGYVDASTGVRHATKQQFGLRQLMIFTSVVAVILGIGRAVVTQMAPRLDLGSYHEVPIFIFLVVAAVLMTLPLMLAAMLPRFAAIGVVLVLLFVAVATAWELTLLSHFHRGPGPDTLHFLWINAFTAAWVVSIAFAVRLSGYELVTSSSKTGAPVEPS
jgi:hypothetical protein